MHYTDGDESAPVCPLCSLSVSLSLISCAPLPLLSMGMCCHRFAGRGIFCSGSRKGQQRGGFGGGGERFGSLGCLRAGSRRRERRLSHDQSGGEFIIIIIMIAAHYTDSFASEIPSIVRLSFGRETSVFPGEEGGRGEIGGWGGREGRRPVAANGERGDNLPRNLPPLLLGDRPTTTWPPPALRDGRRRKRASSSVAPSIMIDHSTFIHCSYGAAGGLGGVAARHTRALIARAIDLFSRLSVLGKGALGEERRADLRDDDEDDGGRRRRRRRSVCARSSFPPPHIPSAAASTAAQPLTLKRRFRHGGTSPTLSHAVLRHKYFFFSLTALERGKRASSGLRVGYDDSCLSTVRRGGCSQCG